MQIKRSAKSKYKHMQKTGLGKAAKGNPKQFCNIIKNMNKMIK